MKALKTRQVCFIIIAIIPVIKLFMMNSVVSEYAKNDMWISVLINLLLDLLVFITVLLFYKKYKMTFIKYLENTFGEKISKIILSFFAVYFIMKSLIPIFEQKGYVSLTLYISTPKITYFLPIFFVSFYLCSQKLMALGRIADLIWPITIIGCLFILFLSIENCDFFAFLPVNYHNTTGIIKGAFYSLNWFGDGLYFLFLIGEFDLQKKDTKKIILSCIFYILLVLLFSFIFYSIFTSIAPRQRYAFTEVSKYSTVINNTGRFDYIGITMILFVTIFSVILPIYFAVSIISEIFNVKTKMLISAVVNLSLLFFTITFNNNFFPIEQFIIKYCSFFYLFMALIVPLFFTLVSLLKRKRSTT